MLQRKLCSIFSPHATHNSSHWVAQPVFLNPRHHQQNRSGVLYVWCHTWRHRLPRVQQPSSIHPNKQFGHVHLSSRAQECQKHNTRCRLSLFVPSTLTDTFAISLAGRLLLLLTWTIFPLSLWRPFFRYEVISYRSQVVVGFFLAKCSFGPVRESDAVCECHRAKPLEELIHRRFLHRCLFQTQLPQAGMNYIMKIRVSSSG